MAGRRELGASAMVGVERRPEEAGGVLRRFVQREASADKRL